MPSCRFPINTWFFCIYLYWKTMGWMYISFYQPAITGVKRMKTKNQWKICACLFLLFLILIGPFLVFSLKWLIGESGDYLICIIKFVPEMLFALNQMWIFKVQSAVHIWFLSFTSILEKCSSVSWAVIVGKIIEW